MKLLKQRSGRCTRLESRFWQGTDAPNPDTSYGVSLHQELLLLTECGLSAEEALRAATSGPAREFGLIDRGRIENGRRADLLLVKGDPTKDIRATRDIVGVWKAGIPIDRNAVAKMAAQSRKARTRKLIRWQGCN